MSHAEQRPSRHQRQLSRIATSLKSPASRRKQEEQTLDRGSRSANDATIAYIKRTLCQKSSKKDILGGDGLSNKSLDELLPPLTSSNDIDVQLYAIIAVILNQVVQSWYNRFTADGDFVAEIVQIIAHCSRGLEERLRHVDLEAFLLDELPALVDAHLLAVMVARDASKGRHESSTVDSRHRLIYHSLRPHQAMTPPPTDAASRLAQDENEVAWCRLIVNNIIPLVLPPEDLLNPCLDVLVSEIFSELIFHKALCGKVSEPWLLWDGVTKLIYTLQPSTRPPTNSALSSPSRLDKFGLLPSSSGASVQAVKGTRGRKVDTVGNIFWSMVQYAMLAWMVLRALVTALIHASALPSRRGGVKGRSHIHKPDHFQVNESQIDSMQASDDVRPIVSMSLWTCICHLTSFDQRMPWLTGLLSLLQWSSLYGPGRICRTNGSIDRLLGVNHLQARYRLSFVNEGQPLETQSHRIVII